MLGGDFKEQIINNIRPNIFDLIIKNIPTNKTKPRKIRKKITINN
jgi:hypothetical protein